MANSRGLAQIGNWPHGQVGARLRGNKACLVEGFCYLNVERGHSAVTDQRISE